MIDQEGREHLIDFLNASCMTGRRYQKSVDETIWYLQLSDIQAPWEFWSTLTQLVVGMNEFWNKDVERLAELNMQSHEFRDTAVEKYSLNKQECDDMMYNIFDKPWEDK